MAQGQAAMGTADDVIQSQVLSRLYGYEVEVLRVKGRIMVIGGQGESEQVLNSLDEVTHRTGEEVAVR